MKALSVTYEFEKGRFPRCKIHKSENFISIELKGDKTYPSVVFFVDTRQEVIDFRDSVWDAWDEFLKEGYKEEKEA